MTTENDQGGTRERVFRLLDESRDLKLLEGNPESVLAKAQEAYGLASGLHSPWQEVAAYRLAQLLFRKPGKALGEYREIDQLLKEAAGNTPSAVSPLGPLPWVYRMASLHRLSIVDPANELKYREDLQVTRQAAMRQFSPRSENGSRSTVERTLGQAQIQSDKFNLIELATYFVDLPYDPLAGRGDTGDDGFSFTGKWILVSNQLETGAVKYTCEFAQAEARALLAADPDSIGFSLQQKKDDGLWLSDHESQPDSAGAKQLALLAAVLWRDDLASSDLQHHLGVADDHLRQLKRRLADELNRRAGRKVVTFEPRSFRLVSEIPIFGAVNLSVLGGL